MLGKKEMALHISAYKENRRQTVVSFCLKGNEYCKFVLWSELEKEVNSLLVTKQHCFEVGREEALENSESDTSYTPC